jgi:hypothetical protein
MEVHAFGKHFGGDENPVIIFRMKSASIEIPYDFLADRLVGAAGKE